MIYVLNVQDRFGGDKDGWHDVNWICFKCVYSECICILQKNLNEADGWITPFNFNCVFEINQNCGWRDHCLQKWNKVLYLEIKRGNWMYLSFFFNGFFWFSKCSRMFQIFYINNNFVILSKYFLIGCQFSITETQHSSSKLV